jgi:hypothetical protein
VGRDILGRRGELLLGDELGNDKMEVDGTRRDVHECAHAIDPPEARIGEVDGLAVGMQEGRLECSREGEDAPQ